MFESKRFLNDHFADPDAVIGLLSAYNLDRPSHDAVKKWFQRQSIPTDWLPVLLCALELDLGDPVRLATYLGGKSGSLKNTAIR